MHRAAELTRSERGDLRLLHHLGTLDRALGRSGRPAHARLERALGPELVRLVHDRLAEPVRLAA